MRRLKKIAIGLAVLVVAVVVAIVAILLSVDYNQYKSVAVAEVEAATGRKFEIAGDLSLSLRLSPRIVLNDVTLANADWGTRPDMLKIKRLEVEVQLLPLLSGEIWVKRLIVKGADILLERSPTGAANWVFGTASNSEANAAAASGGPALPMINDVSIQDSQLRYRDGQTGEEHGLFIDSLLGSASGFDEPVTLAVAARIGDSPLRLDGRFGPLATLFADASYPVDVKVVSGDTTADIKGTIDQPLAGTGLGLAIAIGGRNLADLGPILNITMPSVGPYGLTGNLTDPQGAYRLDPFQLTVGSSAFSGTAAIALGGERPKVTASVVGAAVDLKDFGVTPVGESPPADDGRVFPADPLPLEWMRAVDAAIQLSTERLIKAPVTLQNLKTTLALEAGKLTVANLESGIGEGSFTLSGVVDAAQNPATVDAAIEARKVEVGNLLQTLEISDVLGGGRGDLDLTVKGHGNSVRELMGGLDGTTNFAMAGGHVNNGFARLMLSDLFSLVNLGGGGSSTDINCFVARFDIKGGQATSRGLVLDTSGATIFGSGKINLATEGLALRFDPHAKATNLVNLAIPVQVGGTIANPDVTPDPTAVPGKVVGVVADTANGVFDLLGKVTGTGGSGGEGNPCATALDTASGGKPASSSGTLIDNVGGAVEDTVKGVGDAINKLFQ